jgi:hypothetical protein
MKTYKIPVTWEVYSHIEVEAKSLDEAIQIFDNKENSDENYELPTNPEYVDDSFKREDEETCSLNNQKL